jgi:hypothetical protein
MARFYHVRSVFEIDDALASHGTPSPVATVESIRSR